MNSNASGTLLMTAQPSRHSGLRVLPPVFSAELCAGFDGTRQGCTACSSVCPHEALTRQEGSIDIDPDLCQSCGACVAACPTGALKRQFAPDAEIFSVMAEALAASAAPSPMLRIRCQHGASSAVQLRTFSNGDAVELEAPSLHMLAEGHLLGALALGFRGVTLVPCDQCRDERGLAAPERIVDLANRLLASWGVKGSRCRIQTDPAEDSPAWAATLIPFGNEPWRLRTGALHHRDLIAELAAHFEEAGDGLAHVAACPSDPYGQVTVAAPLCTLCGACARVCPSGALQISTEEGLSFRPVDCVACGLCVTSCGEQAIAVETRLPVGSASRERRSLRQSEWVTCPDCGEITQSKAYVERLESLLDASPFYTSSEQKRLLRMCEPCKSHQRFGGMPTPAESASSEHMPDVERERSHSVPPPIDAEPCVSFCGCELKVGKTPQASPVAAVSRGGDLPRPSFPTTGEIDRRGMLSLIGRWAGAALAIAAVLKPGKLLAAVTRIVPKRKHRYGMVIDIGRCIGCNACTIACKQENKTPPGVSYSVVLNEPLPGSGNRPVPFAKPCFHCENPPCTSVCPVNATYKREQDGIVVVDYDRCIGCRYCITACPYGSRYFDFGERYHEQHNDAEDVRSPEYRQYRERKPGASPIGNVSKCTFCLHLQDESGDYNEKEGRWPACAKTCTAKSIHFGDFMDPDSEVSRLLRERNAIRLKEELGAEPNVYYLP